MSCKAHTVYFIDTESEKLEKSLPILRLESPREVEGTGVRNPSNVPALHDIQDIQASNGVDFDPHARIQHRVVEKERLQLW